MSNQLLETSLIKLVEEMQKTEKDMQRLLKDAEAMMSHVDWKSVRERAASSEEGRNLYKSMINHLVDAYTGIISNCSTHAAACTLSADFVQAQMLLLSKRDSQSLDWILQEANAPSSESNTAEELIRISESFAQLSSIALKELKKYLYISSGV
jgi:hypothetical protein